MRSAVPSAPDRRRVDKFRLSPAGEGVHVSSHVPPGRRRGRVAGLAVASLVVSPLVALAPAASAAPDDTDVVINELYARGGSNSQPYTNKFVELYNPTDEAISLDGM